MTETDKVQARGATKLLVVAGIAALALALVASVWLARAPASYSDYDRLGAEVGCQCGTCPMRPIATCGCGFADRMLEEVRSELAGGATEEEVRARLVSRYGQQVLIVPETSGFDLTAWAVPIIALLVGGVGVAAFLLHLVRRDGDDVDGTTPPDHPATSSRHRTASVPDENGPSETGRDRARRTVEAELDELE